MSKNAFHKAKGGSARPLSSLGMFRPGHAPPPLIVNFSLLILNSSLRPAARFPFPSLDQAFQHLATGVHPPLELGLYLLGRRPGLDFLKQGGAFEVAHAEIEYERAQRIKFPLRVHLGNGIEVSLYRGEVTPQPTLRLLPRAARRGRYSLRRSEAARPHPGGTPVRRVREPLELLYLYYQ